MLRSWSCTAQAWQTTRTGSWDLKTQRPSDDILGHLYKKQHGHKLNSFAFFSRSFGGALRKALHWPSLQSRTCLCSSLCIKHTLLTHLEGSSAWIRGCVVDFVDLLFKFSERLGFWIGGLESFWSFSEKVSSSTSRLRYYLWAHLEKKANDSRPSSSFPSNWSSV